MCEELPRHANTFLWPKGVGYGNRFAGHIKGTIRSCLPKSISLMVGGPEIRWVWVSVDVLVDVMLEL